MNVAARQRLINSKSEARFISGFFVFPQTNVTTSQHSQVCWDVVTWAFFGTVEVIKKREEFFAPQNIYYGVLTQQKSAYTWRIFSARNVLYSSYAWYAPLRAVCGFGSG